MDNKDKKIEIFSTQTCHFCNLAKGWFKEKGLDYQEYDVGADVEKRKEMVEMTGQLGVPVIRIGQDVIIGFNPNKIEEVLSLTV